VIHNIISNFSLAVYWLELYICQEMKNSIKYKRRISTFFLYAYLSFAVLSAFHFHSYSLLNEPQYDVNSRSSSSISHFLDAKNQICAINHFTSTILDYKFSSKDISPCLNNREELRPEFCNKFPSKFFRAKNSPRAPPLFS